MGIRIETDSQIHIAPWRVLATRDRAEKREPTHACCPKLGFVRMQSLDHFVLWVHLDYYTTPLVGSLAYSSRARLYVLNR